MPTAMSIVQPFDAPPAAVYSLFTDREFLADRLKDCGGIDPQVTTLESSGDGATVITRQSIPASVLPSMVASMMSGDPVTERTERWRCGADTYAADFAVIIKGAPASLKGTLTLAVTPAGSTLTVDAQASVPIPMFGARIEQTIVEQVGELMEREAEYTRTVLRRG